MKLSGIKKLTAVGLAASMSISVSAYAANLIQSDMPSIVESANGVFPADMADWLANPTSYSWNPENVRLGFHPDRADPNDSTGASPGVIYIFPDSTAANDWWDPTDPLTPNPRTGIPDTAVAYIHWKLDNNSGQFPGIMAITDDYEFKTNNCIMAAGTTIPEPQNPAGIVKTCSNPQGSSKRFKLVVLKADKPIDFVFNMTTEPLSYENYDLTNFPDNDWYRGYRFIMKFGNGTGTDTVKLDGTPISNPGTRLAGYSVRLGYGVGSTGSIPPAPAPWVETLDNEDDGLSYELRLCIENKYYDKSSNQSKPGKNDCEIGFTELWLENEFATFSPSMYSLTTDKRTTPVGGYWDKNPAGVYAPQLQQKNWLDSGMDAYTPNVDSFGAPYDPYPPAGQVGQTTSNYFDAASSQGTLGSGVTFPDNMFGYLMFYGVFANVPEGNDPGNISSGIYLDDDGDPATEGGLYAWWDGTSPSCCYRWGIDRDFDGVVGPDAFAIVADEHLAWFASRPLDEHQVLDPPRYEVGYMDDLGGLNSDTFIKISNNYDPSIATGNPTFTVRYQAHSVAAAGLLADDKGVPDGSWVANPPMDFADFPDVPPVDPAAPVVPPPSSSSNGCSCSHSPDGSVDPILPAVVLFALGYLGLRRRESSSK